jgi:hypothetical protein
MRRRYAHWRAVTTAGNSLSSPRQHFAPLSGIRGQCNEISLCAVKSASNPLFLLLLQHREDRQFVSLFPLSYTE